MTFYDISVLLLHFLFIEYLNIWSIQQVQVQVGQSSLFYSPDLFSLLVSSQ